MLLNPWEIEVWAATETVLWNILCQQKVEEDEIYKCHCEMVATDFVVSVAVLFRVFLCFELTARRATIRCVEK